MKSHWIVLFALPLLTACLEEPNGVLPAAASDMEALHARLVTLETKLGDLEGRLGAQATSVQTLAVGLDGRLAREEDATTGILTRLAELDSGTATHLQSLDGAVAELQSKLAYVSVGAVNGKPGLIFRGTNLYVQSADGSTPDGTGNVILGAARTSGTAASRAGSHNLLIGGGNNHPGSYSLLVGTDNTAAGDYNVVFGSFNETRGIHSAVLGGRANLAAAADSLILSGLGHQVDDQFASILGGKYNWIEGPPAGVHKGFSVIVGGSENKISNASGSTIVGGAKNIIGTSSRAVIGGGTRNLIGGNYDHATIGGGMDSFAKYPGSFTP
ncbi:MAG: hypothetical protein M3Y59_09260 [Myxococcota bacterium]|nr:hypothetical protein [Myxococcota bacterium]